MAPKMLHVLFEHATGYALFRVKEFEEIGMLQPEVEKSVLDLSRFSSIVTLVSFSPFRSGANALDNMNSISEGILHPDLRAFLEANVPQSTSKKSKSILGLADSKLAASVAEEMGYSCMHTGVVLEIIRGLRVYFPKMIKGLTDVSQGKAQLGLGHSYSRAKVKFNVNRADNMIIQSISLLDQLDKNINTFSMRIREWYGYHFPELVKIIPDNYLYARVVALMGNRKQLSEEKVAGLGEIVMDEGKVKAILDASKSSMGMDISPMDMINVELFAQKVIKLAEYRKSQHEYLKNKMDLVAPNLSALIGEQVGARLISHAGSLTNLAKYPASTVQILGAEKALFRALKTRGNTPKYGLIFHSTFIGRAGAKNKGRISRNLANKCTIASRIDCFSEFPTSIFGEFLKEQVEERLKFYESGEAPRKNVDVMKEAIEKATKVQKKLAKKAKKERKESKANDANHEEAMETATTTTTTATTITTEPEQQQKKKKKRKQQETENDVTGASGDGLLSISQLNNSKVCDDDNDDGQVKKKKKKLSIGPQDGGDEVVAAGGDNSAVLSEKKKKKKLSLTPQEGTGEKVVSEDGGVGENRVVPGEKKKKKKISLDVAVESAIVEGGDVTSEKKKKKKRQSEGNE